MVDKSCLVCGAKHNMIAALKLTADTGLDVEHHLCVKHLEQWIFQAGVLIGEMIRKEQG